MARRPRRVDGKFVRLIAHRHPKNSRKVGVRILRDQINEAIKGESKDLQKYARVRWGTVPPNYPMSTVDAAHRLGISIVDAIALEVRVHELLPFMFQATLPPLETVEQAGDLVADFDVSPQLIIATEAVSTRLVREIVNYPELLRDLHHRKFEELIAFFFGEMGYEVELTKRTRDGGRDVIAVRHGEVDVRYLVECKHPRSGAPIGVGPVRELYAVKVDEGATKALLATTSYFTRDAYLFAERHQWELQLNDYNAVLAWLNRIARGRGA